MAKMRMKDSNGNWQDVSVATGMVYDGSFQMAILDPIAHSSVTSNDSAFDLSPYVSAGEDFMLFFTTGSGVGTTGCIPLVWIKSDGQLRVLHNKVTTQMKNLDVLFPTKTQCAVSYDENTCIFDVVMQDASDSVYGGILFYAGKEA